MAVFEVIYVVAASLWIFVVLTALGIGCHFMMKFRKKRRRINRIFDVVRVPIQFGTQGVLLLRRCESALGLQMLTSEVRSDRRAVFGSRGVSQLRALAPTRGARAR